MYMSKAVPSTYSHIGDLIDVFAEKERTVEYLKSKIKLKSLEKSGGDKFEEVQVKCIYNNEIIYK